MARIFSEQAGDAHIEVGVESKVCERGDTVDCEVRMSTPGEEVTVESVDLRVLSHYRAGTGVTEVVLAEQSVCDELIVVSSLTRSEQTGFKMPAQAPVSIGSINVRVDTSVALERGSYTETTYVDVSPKAPYQSVLDACFESGLRLVETECLGQRAEQSREFAEVLRFSVRGATHERDAKDVSLVSTPTPKGRECCFVRSDGLEPPVDVGDLSAVSVDVAEADLECVTREVRMALTQLGVDGDWEAVP